MRDQVYATNGGEGVDVIMDPLGDEIFSAALRALAWRGRLVVVGFAAGDIPTLKANYLLLKNIEVSGLQVSDYRKRRPDMMAECFADVFQLYDKGKIKAAPVETYPLSNFAEALEASKAAVSKAARSSCLRMTERADFVVVGAGRRDAFWRTD